MRKPVALLLALALTATPALAVDPAVPDWAVDAYAYLETFQIRPDPSGLITRGQFLELLMDTLSAALPPQVLDRVEPKPAGYFSDNYADRYTAARMELAAAYGITEGWVDDVTGLRYGNFTSTLTRAEAAKMVCTTLDFFTAQGYEVTAAGQAAVYTDAALIPDWAAPFTGRVAAYAIMRGDDLLNFNPSGELDSPSAAIIASRTLALMETAAERGQAGLALQSQLDWSGANRFGAGDYSVSKPKLGWAEGYYTAVDDQGAVTAVVFPAAKTTYQDGQFVTTASKQFFVERYDAAGKVTFSKSLPMELSFCGAFLAGQDGNYYLAFGQENDAEDDAAQVWRIVKYDKNWNRAGAASANGGETYTTIPFRSTVARMDLSDDGVLALYASRQRYTSDDGTRHQSNITFLLDTKTMRFTQIMGEPFPQNHVSHSFGQFIRFDGKEPVTVDHGDAYPRSFVLQKGDKSLDLLKIAGSVGQNVTHAIGSGLEVSGDGYLFLGCSTPQKNFDQEKDAPKNLFLTYTDRELKKTALTWLTSGTENIDTARLVKLSDDSFLVLWAQEDGLHTMTVDGKGAPTAEAAVLPGVPMPPTQPAVAGGTVYWIGVPAGDTSPRLYTISLSSVE